MLLKTNMVLRKIARDTIYIFTRITKRTSFITFTFTFYI